MAAHTLVLLVFIDHKDSVKISLSARANTLGRILILGAAFLYILPEYPIFLFIAIAIVTIPLLTIIHKYGQETKTLSE